VKDLPKRRLPFGTAETEVLLKLTSATWGPDWNNQDGRALYESRAMTDAVCQRLVQHGYLEETPVGLKVTYLVTVEGKRKAQQIRQNRHYTQS